MNKLEYALATYRVKKGGVRFAPVSGDADEVREYKNEAEMLAAAGADGWELVSVATMVRASINLRGSAPETDKLHYYFKRPVSN